MAEAFWRLHGRGKWDVVSAGTRPSGQVSPLAVEAMRERGIDISKQKSKSLEPFLNERFDLVVTVCGNAEKTCPTFPGGGRHVHHPFDDPPHAPGTYEDKLKVCRRVRDEIEAKVKEWVAAESD
jgi:arsenate reductase